MQIIGPETIEELTGYKRPCDQKRVLDAMGITYTERRDGTLRTTDDWLNRKDKAATNDDDGFNLSALDHAS